MAKTILEAKSGEKVGSVCGPGESPEENVWTILRRVTNQWGTHLEVRDHTGKRKTVHSFTEVGIGWYYLG